MQKVLVCLKNKRKRNNKRLFTFDLESIVTHSVKLLSVYYLKHIRPTTFSIVKKLLTVTAFFFVFSKFS